MTVLLSNEKCHIESHDIYDGLLDIMKDADVVFTDIPYNQSLLTNYNYRVSERSPNNDIVFDTFLKSLFGIISQLNLKHCFIEVGKENLHTIINNLNAQFKYVTFYNSTYYHSKDNKSYIVHATNNFKSRRFKELEDKDESDIIAWVCRNIDYTCILDPCMGKGLVGINAYINGNRFIGTDINAERLQVLVDKIDKLEG